MKDLHLGNNQISKIEEIEYIKNLESLNLWQNELNERPNLHYLPKLRSFLFFFDHVLYIATFLLKNMSRSLVDQKILSFPFTPFLKAL
ncbi:MAG: hypothetical protein ACFE8T_07460 [Promethearchaeota archaeon]